MKIIESTFFEVVNIEKPVNKSPKISIRFIPTEKIIETVGAVLEAQYSIDEKYILFITEGTPYEEALHILLVDSTLMVADYIELASAYTPGMFRNTSILQPNKIQFSFFDKEETWCLEVAIKPRTKLWANKYPVKRKFPLFHKTWLELKKI